MKKKGMFWRVEKVFYKRKKERKKERNKERKKERKNE